MLNWEKVARRFKRDYMQYIHDVTMYIIIVKERSQGDSAIQIKITIVSLAPIMCDDFSCLSSGGLNNKGRLAITTWERNRDNRCKKFSRCSPQGRRVNESCVLSDQH